MRFHRCGNCGAFWIGAFEDHADPRAYEWPDRPAPALLPDAELANVIDELYMSLDYDPRGGLDRLVAHIEAMEASA